MVAVDDGVAEEEVGEEEIDNEEEEGVSTLSLSSPPVAVGASVMVGVAVAEIFEFTGLSGWSVGFPSGFPVSVGTTTLVVAITGMSA